MPLDYDKKYRDAYRNNAKNAPREAERGELDDKINNFSEKFGFDSERVRYEIANNEIVAALFAKNPNKQNFYEKTAADYISRLSGVKSFKNLGNNKKGLVEGGVYSQKKLKKIGGHSEVKTIDFEWKFKDYTFYASHKHTTQSGGSQDSAYKELQKFIEQANSSTRSNIVFLAIADGEFYQKLDSNAKMTRIDRLREMSNKTKVFACTINEIEELVREIAK